MTEEQIMKALDYHRTTMENHCNECPYKGRLSSIALPSDTLDLIKRQKAEIERLTNAYKQCAWERDTFLEESNSHIERIRGLTRVVYDKEISEAKAEAIKEFAEKFKKKAGSIVTSCQGYEIYETKQYQISAVDFDNLVKEMTEQ